MTFRAFSRFHPGMHASISTRMAFLTSLTLVTPGLKRLRPLGGRFRSFSAFSSAFLFGGGVGLSSLSSPSSLSEVAKHRSSHLSSNASPCVYESDNAFVCLRGEDIYRHSQAQLSSVTPRGQPSTPEHRNTLQDSTTNETRIHVSMSGSNGEGGRAKKARKSHNDAHEQWKHCERCRYTAHCNAAKAREECIGICKSADLRTLLSLQYTAVATLRSSTSAAMQVRACMRVIMLSYV